MVRKRIDTIRLVRSSGEPLPTERCRQGVADNPWGVTARFLPDDLEMGGCADWSWGERVRLCLLAGHQALLVCQSLEATQACAQAAARQPEALWRPAARQFATLRASLPSPGQPFREQAWGAWLEELHTSAAAFGC